MLNTFRAQICKVEGLGGGGQQARFNKFVQIARKESDCNSAKRGGDLGSFGKNKMQKPFEEAAFNLNIGEISQTVETDSGVHIILRVK